MKIHEMLPPRMIQATEDRWHRWAEGQVALVLGNTIPRSRYQASCVRAWTWLANVHRSLEFMKL